MTKVAAIQLTSSDCVDDNLEKAQNLVRQAAAASAELIVLPEDFGLMGRDDFQRVREGEPLGTGRIQHSVSELAKETQTWILGGSIPILPTPDSNKIYSASFLWNDRGETVARYNKIHLFDAQINPGKDQYHESNVVLPGEEVTCVETPFGRLGLSICYDLRFPELYRCLVDQGAEIFLIPSAFTYITGKAHWEPLLRARAIENFCFVVAANQTGTHANQKSTYGSSMIINPWGEILACKKEDEGIVIAEIDVTEVQQQRQRIPALTHRRL